MQVAGVDDGRDSKLGDDVGGEVRGEGKAKSFPRATSCMPVLSGFS